MATKPLRALGWLAVSTSEQAKDEKESIPAQKRDITAVCEDRGWTLIDMLEVPGFSRNYLTLREFAEEALKDGIDAGIKLEAHLHARDFDVFVVRDGDRFGRSQALFAYIAEYIIFVMKKSIYAINGGGIFNEQTGGREWITMQSYRASKEVDDLVRKRSMGMKKRAERGLSTGPFAPFPFKTVRDEQTGKELKVVPDRDQQAIVDAAVTLLLEGWPWESFEIEMFERFGIGRPGRPYTRFYFRDMFYRPRFHGNNAFGITSKVNKRANQTYHGYWMFDPGEPPPDGVVVFYNTNEPYYTGHMLERIQGELRRRRNARGKMRPVDTKPFSSLLICGSCTYAMSYYSNFYKGRSSYQAHRCQSNLRQQYGERPVCDNKGSISIKAIREWLDPRLRQIAATGDLSALINIVSEDNSINEQMIENLRADIAKLEDNVRTLFHRQVPESLQSLWQEELEGLGKMLSAKRAYLADIEHQYSQRAGASSTQQLAVAHLKQIGVDAFWEQSGTLINQTLLNLFGDYRMVVLDKQIIRVSYRPDRLRKTDILTKAWKERR